MPIRKEYAGQPFCTGSAFAFKGDDGDHLAAEIGLTLLPVNNPDPTIVNKTFVPDTWKSGLDQLPYPKNVIASFKKFRDDQSKIDLKARVAELDAQPFSQFHRRVRSGSGPVVGRLRPFQLGRRHQRFLRVGRCGLLSRA